jgi:hypothetical protein
MDDKTLTLKLKQMGELQSKLSILQDEIYSYSKKRYGVDPSEVDNDTFIDACACGTGPSSGMTAGEFHRSMLESMKIVGLSTEGL